MRETWYVLEDGSIADPNDVLTDEKGKLAHRDGVAVAMRGDIPHSRSVDADAERAKIQAAAEATKAKAKPAGKDREIKAGSDSKTYETR